VTYRTRGLKEFVRASQHSEREVKLATRKALRKTGDVVKVEARALLSELSPQAAGTLRTYVRQRGVAVEQSKRKVTGKHPDWGKTQMRHALLPALERKEDEIEETFDREIGRVCEMWATRG